MRVFVTGVEPPVPEAVELLRASHEVASVGELPRDSGVLPGLLDGCEAIVHGGAYVSGLSEDHALDLATRRTYDLCRAAVDGGIQRLVLLSTLDLFGHYPESCRVTEEWQPRPPADTRPLCLYLAELTCREFAREGSLTVTCLRLGHVVREDEVAGQPLDLAWLDARDAAQAVVAALDLAPNPRWGHWRLIHVAAPFPNPRFATHRAQRALKLRPVHTFGAVGEGEQ